MQLITALPNNPLFENTASALTNNLVQKIYYERGFAKLNLWLSVFDRTKTGWHLLSSLAAFTRFGDHLYFSPHQDQFQTQFQTQSQTQSLPFTLSISGDHNTTLAAEPANLVLKAAATLKRLVPQTPSGHFHLHKRIPIAAGLGGGTADAGAALRLLARIMKLDAADARLLEAAVHVGADGPACLFSHHLVMEGFGERITLMPGLPRLYCLLVNPRQSLSTATVFETLAQSRVVKKSLNGHAPSIQKEPPKTPYLLDNRYFSKHDFLDELAKQDNDLTAPAIHVLPIIADVLAALKANKHCAIARMSGSGATCFGLFETREDLHKAHQALQAAHPKWWVKTSVLQ